jgi:hypothetical protein
MSLSPVNSSVSLCFVILHLIPSIRPSLAPLFLRVRSGSHSKILSDNLFPGILFTCPHHSNSPYMSTSQ